MDSDLQGMAESTVPPGDVKSVRIFRLSKFTNVLSSLLVIVIVSACCPSSNQQHAVLKISVFMTNCNVGSNWLDNSPAPGNFWRRSRPKFLRSKMRGRGSLLSVS